MTVVPFFIPTLQRSSGSGPPPTVGEIVWIAAIMVGVVVIGCVLLDCVMDWIESEETLVQTVRKKAQFIGLLFRRII
jgi:hypothetical protein